MVLCRFLACLKSPFLAAAVRPPEAVLAVLIDSVPAVQNYVRANQWPFWTSWGLSLVMIIALGCSQTLRYKVPYNYLFLVGAAPKPPHAL